MRPHHDMKKAFSSQEPRILLVHTKNRTSAQPRLSDHVQRFVSYSQLVRFVKLDGKFVNGGLSLLDSPRCRAVLCADQKDCGLWENETNDAAISTLCLSFLKICLISSSLLLLLLLH